MEFTHEYGIFYAIPEEEEEKKFVEFIGNSHETHLLQPSVIFAKG